MFPRAPAVIKVKPTRTPSGTAGLPSDLNAGLPSLSTDLRTREEIHQQRTPKRAILKNDRRNLPVIPPNFIPKAIPSFSMKRIRNQCPKTLKLSPMDIFVLTRILMT